MAKIATEQLQVTLSTDIKISKKDYGKVYLWDRPYWLRASVEWINDFNKNKKDPTYYVLYWKGDDQFGYHYFRSYKSSDNILEIKQND